jgi:uncharacterized ParB-like nuclease family protein
MPFKSQAQRRLFYAKESRGELPKGTTAKWEAHTPARSLPERLTKKAGGPGSGVGYNNTMPIEEHILSKSKLISLGDRKKIRESVEHKVRAIPVKAITHASQDKYVPSKLNRITAAMDEGTLEDKPVDLLHAKGEHHVIDGHHRVIAAKRLGKEKMKARVYEWGGDMEKKAFWQGFYKKASWGHAAELAGLGTLAVPSIQKLRGKSMSENAAHKTELAGLGVLAAPSAAALGVKAYRAFKGK